MRCEACGGLHHADAHKDPELAKLEVQRASKAGDHMKARLWSRVEDKLRNESLHGARASSTAKKVLTTQSSKVAL